MLWHWTQRNRKSRAAVPRRGVRWRPGLTDNQIVLPRRTRVHSANERFFTKELMSGYERGGIGDRRGSVRYEEDSARGSLYPLLRPGPASRPGILAKSPRSLNLGPSYSGLRK